MTSGESWQYSNFIDLFPHIQVLNLHGNSLNKLPEISRLTALKHLTLSFNEFTHLDDISHMVMRHHHT